jgi:hypothetical protein
LDYKIFGITIRILEPEERIIEIYKEGSMKPTEVKKSYESILYVKKLNLISEKSFNSLVNNIKSEPLVQLLDLFISELDKEG